MKKVRFIIDNGETRKNFICLVKKFFQKELKRDTIKVASQECDIIEFAFKDNGFINIPTKDLRK